MYPVSWGSFGAALQSVAAVLAGVDGPRRDWSW